jgi:serine protease Do
MNRWIKYTALAFATVVITSTAMAQNQSDKTSPNKDEKTKEIIIRKNGDKTEKMTIVVDGDNITINGKPVSDFKRDDVTILQRERITVPRVRTYSRGGTSVNGQGFNNLFPAVANKAMLGVVTEKADDGARITTVSKESGAEKAGLKKDDVITKIGNSKIEDPEDLIRAIREAKPNEKVDITYKRNGKENKTTATLGENKAATAFNLNLNTDDLNFNIPGATMPRIENFNLNYIRKPKIGMQIQDVEEGKGVTVKDVDEASPASKAGIKEGDVITQVNGKDIAGVEELRTEIKDVKEGDAFKVAYKRDGKNQTAEIKIPKRLKTANL